MHPLTTLTRRILPLLLVLLATFPGRGARAETVPAASDLPVVTEATADTVTVGERFDVVYRVAHPDSLRPVTPAKIAAGTCRVVTASWNDAVRNGGREWTGRVTCMAVSIDSVYVPPQPLDFVAPAGDTLRTWSDPVRLSLRFLSAKSQDLRPLKQQWTVPPNYLLWIALGIAGLALAAAVAWWVRRRRARRAAQAPPAVLIPPDIAALTELERIEAMGLVARGEFKTFYTLVVDTLRRYVGARFGVDALDRTTHEIVTDLERTGRRIDGLEALLTEADLVKFAKFQPQAEAADAAIASARDIVVTTTPRPVPVADGEGVAA
jgi:hypothetical protein